MINILSSSGSQIDDLKLHSRVVGFAISCLLEFILEVIKFLHLNHWFGKSILKLPLIFLDGDTKDLLVLVFLYDRAFECVFHMNKIDHLNIIINDPPISDVISHRGPKHQFN